MNKSQASGSLYQENTAVFERPKVGEQRSATRAYYFNEAAQSYGAQGSGTRGSAAAGAVAQLNAAINEQQCAAYAENLQARREFLRRRALRKRKQRLYSLLLIVISILLAAGGIFLFSKYRQSKEPMNFAKRLAKYESALIASARETGVWPSVTAAQLLIEAGDGPNKLADTDNNGFGLKWHDNMARRHRNQAWPVTYQTQEYLNGQYVTIDDLFAKFANFEIGIWEHDRIWWNGYHEEARAVLMDLANGTRDDFVAAVLHYATAPDYRDVLLRVIKERNLDYLDELAFPNGQRLQAGFADMAENAAEEVLSAVQTSSSEQEGEAVSEADLKELANAARAKFFIKIGAYPDDGRNVKDLENSNMADLYTKQN